jgi:hypothetical protein
MLLPRFLRFRYSLRALFVFITIFAAWGGYHGNRAFNERRAETILRRADAHLSRCPPSLHLWPYRFIGEVYVESDLNPSVAWAIGHLPYLRRLTIEAPGKSAMAGSRREWQPRAKIPSGAMQQVLRSNWITDVHLEGWEIPDDACATLGSRPSVSYITLMSCQPTEDGFERIMLAPNLVHICLWSCTVTGEKLTTATGSISIREVECHNTPVHAGFASFLSRCPNLNSLRVDDSAIPTNAGRICDDFLLHLGPHPSLKRLDLSGSSIKAQSLPILKQMPSLRAVELPSHFTEKERDEFIAARPDVAF